MYSVHANKNTGGKGSYIAKPHLSPHQTSGYYYVHCSRQVSTTKSKSGAVVKHQRMLVVYKTTLI